MGGRENELLLGKDLLATREKFMSMGMRMLSKKVDSRVFYEFKIIMQSCEAK